ncbi:MAG TPA: hypothetical protein VGK31_07100 [Thermoanaerobaculia bacterium]|jgi:predicted RNA-binding Zn-ribbon protein involved in translation (DUF1610 family)
MIKITCTSCQKPLSLDETKLPMKEVSFPCPVCKTKLMVDRRKLGAEQPAPVQQSASGEAEEDSEEFGSKAFIIGDDNPALRQAAKLIGFMPVHFATAEQARDRFMQETPQVVFLSLAQITPPPLEAMQPIVGILPADRRKSFFVLVADNLRTMDGNAAFLYGVNLVLAPKDLVTFPRIYKDAYAYHVRLYASMSSVLKAMESQ